MVNIINDWSYLICEDGSITQAFSNEVFDFDCIPATLEYYFDTSINISAPLKTNNNLSYYRIGIGYDINKMKDLKFNNIVYNHILNRNLYSVTSNEIKKIISPEQGLKNILNSNILINSYVEDDLHYILRLLQKSLSEEIISNLGAEGSILFGLSNENSDIDLLLDGSDNFMELLKNWNKIIKYNDRLIKLEDSFIVQEDMYNHRKSYIPFSKEDILFHENRKMFAYLKSANRKYRKINIVGKLNENEGEYIQRYKKYFANYRFLPINDCYVSGTVINDKYSYYIPSIYDVDVNYIYIKNEDIIPGKVEYVIDYIGSYYMQIHNLEKFECYGTLEQMYLNDIPVNKYRISLNPWDKLDNGKPYIKKK